MNWNLTDAHKICTYALVGIAFAALLVANATHPLANGVFLLLGLVSWFWEPPRIRWEQYAGLWLPLTVGVLIALAGAVVVLRANPLDASLYLLLYLTLAKLFQRERPEDYNQAMALSFLVLAATTVYTSDMLFGLLFALYVILGVVNFTLYHLRVQVREYPKAASQSRLFSTRALVTLVWVGLATFILSVGLFFLFPRIGLGFFGRGGAGQQEISQGFEEQVNVGDHGRLNQDTRVVMRVEFPEGRPPLIMPLYWRGVSFDRYDGKSWLRTRLDGQLRVAQDQVVEVRQPAANLSLIRQDIYLEPSPHLVLFALNPLYRVRLPETVQGLRVQVGTLGETQQRAQIIRYRGRSLYVTRTGDVYYNYVGDVGYQYTAWSRPIFPSANDLRRVDMAQTMQQLAQVGLKDVYLQLPKDLNPRIRELAVTLTRNAPTVFDKVETIRAYLSRNFTYTTDLPDPGEEPILDAFLFTHRRGHCEYFATAMAVMLRSIGIPARLVNGYLGGRWNAYDRYLAVQAANAHSWVEVPFAGYGWVTFDPTPPGALPQVGNWWSDLLDALRFRWNKYVLEYDLDTQMEGVKQVQSWLQPRPKSADGGWNAQTAWRAGAVLVLTLAGGVWGYNRRGRWLRLGEGAGLVALTGVTAWIAQPLPWPWSSALGGIAPPLAFFLARYLQGEPAKASVPLVSRLYLQLRQALVEQGLTISADMGPLAVRQVVQVSDLPDRDIALQVINTYMDVRFGERSLSRGELHTYQHHVRRLIQQWRTRQRQKVLH
ncbi:MAG: DUF3488 and transglutaminase-like domain-containing protein [Gloeomargarita sp. SKYG116]|nr:DUF3488 and transglutaminase-like domain-containing protein [Gloeomargarita sp. SKYG116]MDW8401450.1 DUF3488 and transglutaminase-like domain-containing protein [Gloeomargarita sp. SKYGB_i_bin116]